jgi:hypothetical protein
MRESITIQMPVADGHLLHRAVTELTRAPVPERPDTVHVLALLAAGRFDLVAPLLRSPARLGAELPLVLARYVAWTGDLAAAAAAWQHARAVVSAAMDALPPGSAATNEPAIGTAPDAEALVLSAGSLAGMARVATDLGDPQLAARLIGAARVPLQRLADQPLPPHVAELVTAINLVEDAVPAAFWHDHALRAPLATDDGSHPDTHRPDAASGAARLILALVHGSLGVEPDATRHRLRIRLRLPADYPDLRVDDIGFGDGTIGLHVSQTADSILVRIRQDTGAVPVTVLLEPVLAGGSVMLAPTVDGVAAALSPRPAADGTMVPVQLVLDADRELLLQLDAQRPPT